jgi:hypothetical protein
MKKLSTTKQIVIAAVVIVAIGVGMRLVPGYLGSSVLSNVDTSTYQAVTLDNNETYFGKITDSNADSLTLSDVYYFKDGDKTKLIKKGSEIYGPEDAVTINLSRVVSTENLLETGKVMQAIQKYKASK